MANVKFYLLNKKKNNSLIYAQYYLTYYEIGENGKKSFKRLKYYTGESINPKYWNEKTNRANKSKEFPQHPEFNQRLNDIETAIKDVFRKMLNDGKGNEITPKILNENVKKHLESLNKTIKPINNKTGFTEFIKTIINESKTGERLTANGTRIKPRTILSYNTTLNKLLEYETDKKIKLKFSDINMKFYKNYLTYLNSKTLAVNTIGGHIKNIKVFMRIATSQKLNEPKNNDFETKEFTKIEEEVQNIYLSETELRKIYEKDFTDDKKLETVRDIFIIGCYTGLRFSDLKQLRKEHFVNDNVIKITTVKTNESVTIPLHWTVREILNKYEYNLPRVISNQKMNEYLKKIGEKAEINEPIILTQTRGGFKIEKNKLKYELIGVHTARRSFATNMYLNKVDILRIRKITGHKTDKVFLRYIKISADENANDLLNHPFFNPSKIIKVAN